MNVKKTKKFKENHPESYHVHDNLLLLKREEQQFQSLGQRMDDNKDNELIVQKSNWFVGF